MDVYQEIQIYEPTNRPHLLRREIALPQRRRMNLEELVPRTSTTQGTGIEIMFLEDILHRLAGDPPDPELAKLTENAGRTERRLHPISARALMQADAILASFDQDGIRPHFG